jgi:Domain of unknown function (DUF4062)
MHDKRHSIFISSTFEDLKTERQAVQDAIISAGDFPVQMESFPAADEDQFEFIKALIDKCDYYVLIVAGRYGTPSNDGVSYTEKEYRYAKSKGIPILAMMHENRGSLPANLSEDTADGKTRLAVFITEVESNRLRKLWKTTDALKLAVREALDHAKITKPAVGWIRGDTIASLAALEELNEVRKENEKYRDEINSLEVELALPPIPSATDQINIDILPNTDRRSNRGFCGSAATVTATWIASFPVFFNNLIWDMHDWGGENSYSIDYEQSCIKIGSAIAGQTELIDAEDAFKISKSILSRLMNYYIEVGLMNPLGSDRVFTDKAGKLARRHNINGEPSSDFSLVRGALTVTPFVPNYAELDDEIPF